MGSTDNNTTAKSPINGEHDYVEITKSNVEFDKKFSEETGVPSTIIYYCNDCEKIITPKRIGKKLKFSCSECKGGNVSFGTEVAIKNYYKIKG